MMNDNKKRYGMALRLLILIICFDHLLRLSNSLATYGMKEIIGHTSIKWSSIFAAVCMLFLLCFVIRIIIMILIKKYKIHENKYKKILHYITYAEGVAISIWFMAIIVELYMAYNNIFN